MSTTASAIAAAVKSPTTKEGWSFGFKVLVWVLVFLIIAAIIYYFVWVRGVDQTKVNELASKASSPYSQPKEVENLIRQGVKDIENNPYKMKRAKEFAKTSGIPIEQILVDMAVTEAKNYGYIQTA